MIEAKLDEIANSLKKVARAIELVSQAQAELADKLPAHILRNLKGAIGSMNYAITETETWKKREGYV
jgi:hypothetical protein